MKILRASGYAVGLALVIGATVLVVRADARRAATAEAAKPIAFIGLNQCDRFLGGIVVAGDGSIHGFPGMPLDTAKELAKSLPDGHAQAINTPCGKPPDATT